MKMSKLAASLLAAGVLGVSGAAAEGRSFFVGGGFNYHSINRLYEYFGPSTSYINHGYTEEDGASGGGFSLVAGSTIMRSANSGVRTYLNYDVNYVDIKYEDTSETDSGKYQVIGFNADWLYNFQPNFGVFVGANIGVISWDKKLWRLTDSDSLLTKFYFAGQFGGRFMFGEGGNQAVEVFAKIPFTTQKVEYTTAAGELEDEVKIRQSISAGVRYIYSF